jgi:hypothetical protein
VGRSARGEDSADLTPNCLVRARARRVRIGVADQVGSTWIPSGVCRTTVSEKFWAPGRLLGRTRSHLEPGLGHTKADGE